MDEFTLPTDLTTVAEADLDALEAQATEAFDGIAAAPEGEADLTTMSDLADAIEAPPDVVAAPSAKWKTFSCGLKAATASRRGASAPRAAP